jgi:HK97 family phage major capsid protein
MSKALREERNRLIHQSRQIHEDADKRGLRTDERIVYDRLADQVDKLDGDLERSRRRSTPAPDHSETVWPATGTDSSEYRSRFHAYLKSGHKKMGTEEHRALQNDGASGGGYLIAPQDFVNDVVVMVTDRVYVRQLARVFDVPKAESLGAPSVDANPADADWTTEIKTGSEESTMTFGKRELVPQPVAKLLKVSRTVLERGGKNAEELVKERLAYKFGITQEKAFMTGNGSQQPLGVFTANSAGIDTSRDVTCSSTTAFSADDLITAKYTLKAQYLESPSVRWAFHRDAIKRIRQLKDASGQYVWRSGIDDSEDDTIVGVPYLMSEYAPNTFTTGLSVGMIGDFWQYWIADAKTFSVQRLDELYAEANQVGLIGRMESDGMPALAEAFARLKLA